MKLLDKLKDILFDEEEEEVEEQVIPKKVVNHNVEDNLSSEEVEEKPVKEEKKEEKFNNFNRDLNLENTFKFPLFDEQEFENTKPKNNVEVKKNFGLDEVDTFKTEFRREERKEERPINNVSKDYTAFVKEQPKEKKTFKPSPIISPVYGILDKNYDRNGVIDIGTLNTTTLPDKPKPLNVDDVRKKAFGQLDSNLEQQYQKKLEEFSPTSVTITEITTTVPEPSVDDETSDTMELKQTLTGIRENLENISDKMADIETKVDNHFDNEDDLDKPRSAVELLNQIEDELDKTLELRKQDIEEIKDDYLDDFDDVKFDDEEEVVEDVKTEDVTDSDNDELFNLIDAMYDNNEDDLDKDSEE
ncbi:MAG: hypothetical protein J5892_02050 [Bacilli bacterium]|nr:hypothetical protein [Bacilli bacterium]